jgi:hypothetical protein
MVRFYSSIYANDKMLIRLMFCDSAFHGSPHQKSLPYIERRFEMPGRLSPITRTNLSLVRVRNSLLLAQRHDI